MLCFENVEKDIESFKARNVKAKTVFYIKEVSKPIAYEFVKSYHYLGDARFFAMRCYGLFHKDTDCLLGVATFSNPQGNVALKGWFGLPNSDQTVLELSRLCVLPTLNGTNATSYLLGGSIKCMRKEGLIRAIITLADSSRHVGSIYQVCNFKYYGLTDVKSDFVRFDGKVNPRGSTKNTHGVWIPRTRKHRYAFILDNTLKCLYNESVPPKKEDTIHEKVCTACGGTRKVFDKRFNEWYTCPHCTGFFKRIENEKEGT